MDGKAVRRAEMRHRGRREWVELPKGRARIVCAVTVRGGPRPIAEEDRVYEYGNLSEWSLIPCGGEKQVREVSRKRVMELLGKPGDTSPRFWSLWKVPREHVGALLAELGVGQRFIAHLWEADTVRLIKMTDAMLKVGEDRNLTVDEFFASMKGERDGQFLVPKGWIGEGELGVGEAVLFSHKGEVKYVARTASGREDHHGRDSDQFPYKFRIDPDTVRRVRVGLEDLAERLERAGAKVSLKGRGWTKIDETREVRKVFEEISGSGSGV